MKKTGSISAALGALAARIGLASAQEVDDAMANELMKVTDKMPTKSGVTQTSAVSKKRHRRVPYSLHIPERQVDESMTQYRARQAASRAHVAHITCKGMSGGSNTRADLRANTRMRLRAEGKKRAAKNRMLQRIFNLPRDVAWISASA